MKKEILLLVLALSNLFFSQAQNLILNPGCDDTLVGGEIPHWQELTGDEWTQRLENPDPFGGSSYFFPGSVAEAELGQTIDIAADSIQIDNGTKYYYFTGYVRAFSQSPSDESNILLKFRDGGDTPLDSCLLGPYNQTAVWLRLDTALLAPVGARKADIVLRSLRHNGSNNDGYYDELYFGNSPLVAVREIKMNLCFSVYPNPSGGHFSIDLPELKDKNWTLSIRNISGQLLEEKRMTGNPVVLTMDRADGIYFLTIETDKEIYSSKVLIKR